VTARSDSSQVDVVLERVRAFVAAFHAGEDPNPHEFCAGLAAPEREAVLALIDVYLAEAPRTPPPNPDPLVERVVERAARSLRGRSGLWPLVLPALRERARKLRRDVANELAARLGAAGREQKVADYYHRMEQGVLDAQRVSDTVLDALARVLGTTAADLRAAARSLAPASPPSEPGVVFARAVDGETEPREQRHPGGRQQDGEQFDEIDRLFLGDPPRER